MLEMCLPRLRWTLQHSLHTNTPRLMEAHDGSRGDVNTVKVIALREQLRLPTWRAAVSADVHRVIHPRQILRYSLYRLTSSLRSSPRTHLQLKSGGDTAHQTRTCTYSDASSLNTSVTLNKRKEKLIRVGSSPDYTRRIMYIVHYTTATKHCGG